MIFFCVIPRFALNSTMATIHEVNAKIGELRDQIAKLEIDERAEQEKVEKLVASKNKVTSELTEKKNQLAQQLNEFHRFHGWAVLKIKK